MPVFLSHQSQCHKEAPVERKATMSEMTTFERMQKIYRHETPDRVPVTDWFWESTLWRWRREGLPAHVDLEDFFGIDRFRLLTVGVIDTSPRFERLVLEETDAYIIERDAWGATTKNYKPISATFQHIEQELKDKDSWLKIKQRMTPDKDRINWDVFSNNHAKWRKDGSWIQVGPWAGYDVINTRMCNTETILYAMCDDPDWVADMFNTQTDLALDLCQMLFDAGYAFDELLWYDDMAYKNGLIFSKKIWEELVKPYQKKAMDWAHNHDIKFHLHCCGNIGPLIPELMDLGMDMLNPLEVKAGMNPVRIKKQYGDRLALRGGFDARNWSDFEKMQEDIQIVLPEMMKSGGYVFSSDHSIPDDVSLENYRRIVDFVKEAGRYDK